MSRAPEAEAAGPVDGADDGEGGLPGIDVRRPRDRFVRDDDGRLEAARGVDEVAQRAGEVGGVAAVGRQIMGCPADLMTRL